MHFNDTAVSKNETLAYETAPQITEFKAIQGAVDE